MLLRLQHIVERMSNDIFGYHALECGVLTGQQRLLSHSRINNRFSLGMVEGEDVSALGLPESLPFEMNNIDLVVASHALDYTPNSHQVLREIDRVLVPEGHCILIGFNALSFKGIGQLRYLLSPYQAPCRHYSTYRIREWLSVLGFEVCEVLSTGFCPTVGEEYLFKHTRWMDNVGERFRFVTGNVYIIHAQKKVSNLTLLPPLKRKKRPILKPGMVVNSNAGQLSRYEQTDEQDS